jgi:hypothetical protein
MKKLCICASLVVALLSGVSAQAQKVKSVSNKVHENGVPGTAGYKKTTVSDTEYCCSPCVTPPAKKVVKKAKVIPKIVSPPLVLPAPIVRNETTVVNLIVVDDRRTVPPSPQLKLHDTCDVVDFSAWPPQPKYGDKIRLDWRLKGDCLKNVVITGGIVTFNESSSSATTERIYGPQQFTLTATDAYNGRTVSKTLSVSPILLGASDLCHHHHKTWLGRNWPWVVPATLAVVGGGIYVGYKMAHPKVIAAVQPTPTPNPGQTGGPANVQTINPSGP